MITAQYLHSKSKKSRYFATFYHNGLNAPRELLAIYMKLSGECY